MDAPKPTTQRCPFSEQGLNRLAREFTAIFKVMVTAEHLKRLYDEVRREEQRGKT